MENQKNLINSNITTDNIVNKNNFHKKLYEFKFLLKNNSKKIIIINLIDSLNYNYSKTFSNLENFSKSENFFDEIFYPLISKNINSQILFTEITILYENQQNEKVNCYEKETFLIPSLKFHKFISESYLDLNPSLLNFIGRNKNLYNTKILFDIDSLSYMPKSVENFLQSNFEKIRKYGKKTKNENKKSYYFYPKSLVIPNENIKSQITKIFKDLNLKFVDMKKYNFIDEKINKDKKDENKDTHKIILNDLFSVEKLMEFEWMYFFPKFDERFLDITLTRFDFKVFPNLNEKIFFENIKKEEILQLDFTVVFLKKIYFDIYLIYYRIYSQLVGKKHSVFNYFENLKDYFSKNLDFNQDYIKNPNFFSTFEIDVNHQNLFNSGGINEIYFSNISKILNEILNEKIIFNFSNTPLNKDKNLEIQINYFLTQAPGYKMIYSLDILLIFLIKFISFLENLVNFSFSPDNEENQKFFNLKKNPIKSYENIEQSYEFLLDNTNKIYENLKSNQEKYNSNLNFINLKFYFDTNEILEILKIFYPIDENKIKFSYKFFEHFQNFLPENLKKLFSSKYQINLISDLNLLPNIETREIKNLTYENLFLNLNNEKELLFNYEIEKVIYDFLKFDLLNGMKNQILNETNFNNFKPDSDTKKFYSDFTTFLDFDESLNFKKILYEKIFEKNVCEFNIKEKPVFIFVNDQGKLNNFYEKLEKNILEKKNELLELFTSIKANFIIKEEFGVFNFIDEIFNISENSKENLLITGIDLNSIIIKLFNEMYINHRLMDIDRNKKENIKKFKEILKKKFFTKNYLDLNYIFNNKNLNIKINDQDYLKIVGVYNDKKFLDKNDNSKNKTDYRLTLKICDFLINKFFPSNNIENISNFILFGNNSLFVNKLFIGKRNKENEEVLLALQINKNNISALVENELKKNISSNNDKEKKNKSLIIKFDCNKRINVINFLRKFTDFYVFIFINYF